MEPVLALDVHVPPRGSRARLRTLHAQLRNGIVQGRLHAGLLLPSTRLLAREYGVSRNTAVAAYELLAAEGYVVTRPGGGTFVAAIAPRRSERPRRTTAEGHDARLNGYWRDRSAMTPPSSLPGIAFDFALGLPDKGMFPFDIWRRLSARSLRALSRTPAAYAEAQGRASLRQAASAHASYARAVSCAADDLVITSGAQQAFDLLARILVTPGKTVVAVEDPGYPPLRRAFEAAGARIAAVAVDSQGMQIDRIPPGARVVCVTPSHQFPLGMPLSMERRTALLELARRRHAVILEDDYDGEYRFGGRPLDALQTLDREQCVFYVGTFSKSLFPALRLGYVVAPPWARNALIAAKQAADWHCAVLPQDTLAAFIAAGHLARHVRKMRRVYGERREALLAGLARHFSGQLDVLPSDSGLHIACTSTNAGRIRALVARAHANGIRLPSIEAFTMGPSHRHGIVFGLGRMASEEIDRGVRKLASLVP
ncbi:MAG TPA: PLP-dependent aminotransferase family protein [Zeimonas sp.]